MHFLPAQYDPVTFFLQKFFLAGRGRTLDDMQQQERDGEMEEVEASIAQARQSLLPGPATSDQRRNVIKALISERIPRAVERVQRQPMSTTTAKRAAKFFAVVQDFADACLRSLLLGEGLGPLRLDLSPLLYVLRLILAAEPVPSRYLSGAEATAAGAVPLHYFNRDHGRPLVREFRGCSRRIWPDDEQATR